VDRNTFDELTRTIASVSTRRRFGGMLAALGLGAVASLRLPGADEAEAKKPCTKVGQKPKKKKRCCKGLVKDGTGRCAHPPKPHICAGQNHCVTASTCQASGTQCYCWVRADGGHVGESFCGQAPLGPAADCYACSGSEVCILLGGECADGDYACALPCPNPL
jgi:hypothetical protein